MGFTLWMDVNVRVLLFLVRLDLHVFSVVCLHRGIHSAQTGLSTHLHFHKYLGSDVSTPSPKSHFLHPPRDFPPTQSKRGFGGQ